MAVWASTIWEEVYPDLRAYCPDCLLTLQEQFEQYRFYCGLCPHNFCLSNRTHNCPCALALIKSAGNPDGDSELMSVEVKVNDKDTIVYPYTYNEESGTPPEIVYTMSNTLLLLARRFLLVRTQPNQKYLHARLAHVSQLWKTRVLPALQESSRALDTLNFRFSLSDFITLRSDVRNSDIRITKHAPRKTSDMERALEAMNVMLDLYVTIRMEDRSFTAPVFDLDLALSTDVGRLKLFGDLMFYPIAHWTAYFLDTAHKLASPVDVSIEETEAKRVPLPPTYAEYFAFEQKHLPHEEFAGFLYVNLALSLTGTTILSQSVLKSHQLLLASSGLPPMEVNNRSELVLKSSSDEKKKTTVIASSEYADFLLRQWHSGLDRTATALLVERFNPFTFYEPTSLTHGLRSLV